MYIMYAVPTRIENQGMSAVPTACMLSSAEHLHRIVFVIFVAKTVETAYVRCTSTSFPKDLSSGRRIRERTISLMFLSIMLRVLRLEVSAYNPLFLKGGGV